MAGAVVAVSTAGADPSSREVPEDVVGEILLRLPGPSSLARAAAASASFRALVSSPRFLRRHRALHPDAASGPFLGVFCSASASPAREPAGAFHPAEPPHPAAAAALAVATAADFSFSFLPNGPEAWLVRDYRDGRFLLDRPSSDAANSSSKVFTDLAVCDPVSRRHVLLPPIPEELTTTVHNPLGVLGGLRRCEPFLAPHSSSSPSFSEDSEPSFMVIWTARCPRKVAAFAFTSRDKEWRALPSPDCFVWRSRRSPFACPVHAVWNRRHYAHGRFYWVDCLSNRWLVLDTTANANANANAMELRVEEIPSPARYWEENVAVVEGAAGAVGVFAHDFYHADGEASLSYYTIPPRDGGGGGAPAWRLERTVPLPWPSTHGRPYCIRNAGNGCLIVEVARDSPPRPFFSGQCSRDVELFKIDAEEFRLERVCKARCAGGVGDGYWPYFGFPPLLALPTV